MSNAKSKTTNTGLPTSSFPLPASDIKLFITDIDGVWTDGGMYYDETGNEWKKFNTSDSAGVLFLKLLDIPTAIITGENSQIVKRRADKLKITDCFLGIKDKVSSAESLLNKYKLNWSEVAYIGDDINDIKLLEKVGLSACPNNAPDYIKSRVNWVLTKSGGEGAYREFVESYLSKKELLNKVIDLYLNTSKKLDQ
ncbi:HAD-IIIA family hydrolase [Aureibaculum marinum]|uniref:HAD-IIIA family hydrolase n=1 Tax=Aureibaculum marinum TaxID=2487930 RepID=A0A3N4NX60_9FLAO|nr:HAD-IIIA family hydrolase [Aureibaculum marinum]RPD91713.1 HAD-IIIA family hydrolase [Aureibaculum marinum]